MNNEESAKIVLLHSFESPKKDWTLISFGFEVNGTYEKGFKPLEMWYPRKGIVSQINPDLYGRIVDAKFIYENDTRNPNQMTRKVSEFTVDGNTIKLV